MTLPSNIKVTTKFVTGGIDSKPKKSFAPKLVGDTKTCGVGGTFDLSAKYSATLEPRSLKKS